MTDPDPAQTYERLRAETAEMLKLDAANLSLVEGLQLDLVSLLRLEVDGLQGQVLAGAAVDLARLSTALGLLQKLLPTQLVAPAAAADHDFAGAREELRALFEQRAAAFERRMAMDPQRARAEFEEKLTRAIEQHSSRVLDASSTDNLGNSEVGKNASKPAGGDARHDGVVSLPAPVEPAAAAGGSLPVLVSPVPPPPPPPPPASAAERAANVERLNAQPANPAPEPIPEWRRWVDENGIRSSPWRRY